MDTKGSTIFTNFIDFGDFIDFTDLFHKIVEYLFLKKGSVDDLEF